MIYTLTMNPAIDMNMDCDTVEPSKVNRANHVVYSPNGKGVNVSLVLKYFQKETAVLGFFGGFSGDYIIQSLRQQGIEVIPCLVDEPTRINAFVSHGDEEYKFVNQGAFVSKQKQTELIQQIQTLEVGSTLVISGSLPPGIDEEYYDEILSCSEKQQLSVILDISSPKLKSLLQYRPLLIKPNDDELTSIFGYELQTKSQIKAACLDLHQKGAQHILLTCGEQGCFFYDGIDLYEVTPKAIQLVSSACCGDACLAAFLSEWLTKQPSIEYALKKGAAIGADVATSYGLGSFEKFESFIQDIHVIKGD